MGETPWAFRHRGALLGLVYGLSAMLSTWIDRAGLWPGTPFDHFLALDRGFWLGRLSDPAPAPGLAWEMAVPVAFLAVCFALRAWGTSYLRGHVMADREMHSDRLIVAGPFRWVRNPLYLGNLFMAAAFGLLLPPPGLLLIVGGHLAVLGWLSHVEGQGLRERHGAAYEDYARRVHAFWPKPPGPGVPNAPVQPDWRNGLATESWHLGFAVYLVSLAVRNQAGTWVGVALVIGVMFVNRSRNRRARAASQPPA
jgi:protein-S-isoprenylcysteine O-methyltransferase Ste14